LTHPMIVSGSDYLALPREPETWLIDGLLPVSGSMLLYGDPKVGKSYAALQLATCMTAGVDWLGFSIPQAHPVVYVQLDTPRTLWAKRVQDLVSAGFPVDAVHQTDRQLLDCFPFDILKPDHFKKLTIALSSLSVKSDEGEEVDTPPGAVIIDTLREAHSGDENDSTEMQEVIASLEACVKPAALILVSHSRKSNPEQGYSLMNDNRGSNYIVGRMDAICRFSPKSMRVTSRSMEEHSVDLERNDDGTWSPKQDQLRDAAKALLLNEEAPIRELSRALHEMFPGKSEAACRALLRRMRGI
jgi:RecA-family ATPase